MPEANERDYTIDSQQNLMAVVEYLSRAWPIPQPVQAVVQETGLSRDQAFRTLKNLSTGLWADSTADGWLLAPHLCQISERLRFQLHHLHHRYLGD